MYWMDSCVQMESRAFLAHAFLARQDHHRVVREGIDIFLVGIRGVRSLVEAFEEFRDRRVDW